MSNDPQQMTQSAVRSLLWGGTAQSSQPVPDNAEQLDELTLAKIRLLQMRRPPASQLAAVMRNPIPWTVGGVLVGMLLGRSKAARAVLAWAGTRVAKQTFLQAGKRVKSRKKQAAWGPTTNNGHSAAARLLGWVRAGL